MIFALCASDIFRPWRNGSGTHLDLFDNRINSCLAVRFLENLLQKLVFSLRIDRIFYQFFPLPRGTFHFFLCQKEKSSKKEVGNLAG